VEPDPPRSRNGLFLGWRDIFHAVRKSKWSQKKRPWIRLSCDYFVDISAKKGRMQRRFEVGFSLRIPVDFAESVKGGVFS